MEPLNHLALIWAGTLVAVIAARATRLTPVLYYLAVGSVLVNLGWLPETSHPFIRGFAEVGIIVVMLALGFEENTSDFLNSVKRSWGIAFFGGLAPFLCAYFLAWYFWGDVNIALMCGLAMTATAVSLTMVSLRGEGLQRSPVATRIMTSAVIDDIAALALMAVLVPVATGDEGLNAGDIALVAGKAALFFMAVSVIGAWIIPHESRGWFSRLPLVSRYGAKHVLSFGRGEFVTVMVLLFALVVGLLGHALGLHVAVGAYMAGLILKQEYFHERDEAGSYQDTKRIIDNIAFSWIGPVFFVVLGTRLVLDVDIFLSVIPETAVLTVGLFAAQVSSAGLAARFTGGLTLPAAVMVGLGMLGRAELAFVVMEIAYIQNAVLNREAFYTLMFAAFWLNVAVPVTIRLWRPYYERSREAAGAE
jgi:Kef-type K+ transport system membrane component KefB